MSCLYISDLDGTLLQNDGTLSAYSRSVLNGLLNDGMAFSVASARSVVSMQPILHGLGLSLPVIEFNGAFLSDLETGRHEVVNSIEADIAAEIFGLLSGFSCSPFVSTFNGSADCLYYGEPTNEGEQYYVSSRRRALDSRLRPMEDVSSALGEQVVCLTAIARLEALTNLEHALDKRFGDRVEIHLFENRYSPGWFWLTMHDRRATKAQAIELLIERYGLGGHDLVVFGDHINDIKMFELASEAVAVDNAVPDVKQRATQLIGPNHEDSVVKCIDDHHTSRRTGASKAPRAL